MDEALPGEEEGTLAAAAPVAFEAAAAAPSSASAWNDLDVAGATAAPGVGVVSVVAASLALPPPPPPPPPSPPPPPPPPPINPAPGANPLLSAPAGRSSLPEAIAGIVIGCVACVCIACCVLGLCWRQRRFKNLQVEGWEMGADAVAQAELVEEGATQGGSCNSVTEAFAPNGNPT